MYIKDDIVYAGEPLRGLKVAHARIVNDHSMLVRFSTGETRLFDATEILDMPAFASLIDQTVFEAFSLDRGALTWLEGEIDIAPEAIYEKSYQYDASA